MPADELMFGIGNHSPKGEIAPLTGLRGFAAMWVVIYHLTYPDATDGAVPSVFLSKGYLAVDVFFVLSGYVLTLSYGHLLSEGTTAKAACMLFVRRLVRIYPAYLFWFIYFVLKHVLRGNGPDLAIGPYVVNLALMQAWIPGTMSIIGPSWSISTEIFSYICFPFIVVIAGRSTLPAGSLLLPAVAGIVLVADAPTLHPSGTLDVSGSDTLWPMVRCLSGFSIGICLQRASALRAWTAICGTEAFFHAVLAVLILLFVFAPDDLCLYPLLAALVACCGSQSRSVNILFANKAVYFVGVISYSLYLCHEGVVFAARRALDHATASLPGGPAMSSLGAIGASVAVASVSWYVLEFRARKWLSTRLDARLPISGLRPRPVTHARPARR